MWQTKSLSGALENSHLGEDGYKPPEKKSKEGIESTALKEALECCKNHEIGIEEASLIYGIPKSTLRAKLNDINCSAIDENYRVFVLSIYPTEAEADLVSYLQDCVASQITMTLTEIRRLAYELVCEKYKVTNLPKGKNCILGRRWCQNLMKKYSHLNLGSKILSVKEEKSLDFYNSLDTFFNKFHIGVNQIYAVDGVDLKFRASCADEEKIFCKRRSMYTNAKALCCVSPVGDFVPPVFLKLQNSNALSSKQEELAEYNLNFLNGNCQKNLELNKVCDKLKEISKINIKNFPSFEDLLSIKKQIKMHLNKKLQPMSEENKEELREKLYNQFEQLKNKIITKCENSLNEITPEIFYDWFFGFLSHVKPNPKKTVLLILPDSKYVKSFKILELGKKNNVIFLVLPPHSSHKIYPLDGFSMSLNRNLSVCAKRWLSKNSDFNIQQVPLHVIFMEAFNETKNPLIAKNGFLYSGIWPINRHIFDSSELGGESVLVLNKQKLVVNERIALGSAVIKRNSLSSFGIMNESDLRKLCRVCIKEKIYMKPLLETVPPRAPNYHGKKIYEITKVNISSEDDLPPSICQYCLVQLMDAIKVKEMTVDSHKRQLKLREALDRFYFHQDESENQDLAYLFSCATSHVNDPKIISRILSKNFDINSICRICMEEKPLMTSIFFRPPNNTVLCSDTCNRIMEISHYQVHLHDGLSSSICPFCRASVHKASDFIRKVLNSDKILREIISNFRNKIFK